MSQNSEIAKKTTLFGTKENLWNNYLTILQLTTLFQSFFLSIYPCKQYWYKYCLFLSRTHKSYLITNLCLMYNSSFSTVLLFKNILHKSPCPIISSKISLEYVRGYPLYKGIYITFDILWNIFAHKGTLIRKIISMYSGIIDEATTFEQKLKSY